MPKETITSPSQWGEPAGDAVSTLDVRWGRNGFVELGARVVYSVDRSQDYTTEKGDTIQGRYMSLERKEINELIRTLRKARDQAFGKDE